MQLKFISLFVQDQEKALKFFTGVLQFKKSSDIPMGEYRWLTVVSPEGMEGVELVLEPLAFEPARVFQKALFDAGVPANAFLTSNLMEEFTRLKAQGVVFHGEPLSQDGITSILFEDTCGNLINLVQPGLVQP